MPSGDINISVAGALLLLVTLIVGMMAGYNKGVEDASRYYRNKAEGKEGIRL